MRSDGGVGWRVEVAVATVFRRVDDDRISAVALDMRMSACIDAVAHGQFGAKASSDGHRSVTGPECHRSPLSQT